MRTKHDNQCLWWKDCHSCSCGFLEEEIRNEKIISYSTTKENTDTLEVCLEIVPGTFIVCGEGYGDERQYCSQYCYKKAKHSQD